MYNGSHVYRVGAQPRLPASDPPPRRLARRQEDPQAHPRQPVRLAAPQDRPVSALVARRNAGLTGDVFDTERTLPHGHVEAVLGTIRNIGLETVIAAKRSRERDLVVAMIAERLLHPCSKLATTRLWHTTTLAEELAVEDADEDDLYAAMDWLLARQDRIEQKLAARHLTDGAVVLYDVSSSYYEGRTCPLARFGHDRDGHTGRPIIVYGVLTDGDWRPIAVSVYPGNTADPTTVRDQVDTLRAR